MFFLPPSTTMAPAILCASKVSLVYFRSEYATRLISSSALRRSAARSPRYQGRSQSRLPQAGEGVRAGFMNFGCCCLMVQRVPAARRTTALIP